MDRDAETIRDLVAAQGSLPNLIAAASAVNRFDVPVRAWVKAAAVLSVLDRWESGEITAETATAWARAVGADWSDDVQADPAHEDQIRMALLSLSSPLMNGPLNATMADQIRTDLEAAVRATASLDPTPPAGARTADPHGYRLLDRSLAFIAAEVRHSGNEAVALEVDRAREYAIGSPSEFLGEARIALRLVAGLERAPRSIRRFAEELVAEIDEGFRRVAAG